MATIKQSGCAILKMSTTRGLRPCVTLFVRSRAPLSSREPTKSARQAARWNLPPKVSMAHSESFDSNNRITLLPSYLRQRQTRTLNKTQFLLRPTRTSFAAHGIADDEYSSRAGVPFFAAVVKGGSGNADAELGTGHWICGWQNGVSPRRKTRYASEYPLVYSQGSDTTLECECPKPLSLVAPNLPSLIAG
jgi:hypothetical protein